MSTRCHRRRKARGNIVVNGRSFNRCELEAFIRNCCPRNVVINSGNNSNRGIWAALLALWYFWL